MAGHVHATDFYRDVAEGMIAGHEIVHRYGHTDSMDTTLAPIAEGRVYQTATALTALEIVSSSANDTAAAGTGARIVTVTGISTGWLEVSEDVSMAGLTPVALANTYYRITGVEVKTSGSYAAATATAGSHVGTITVRVPGPGASWAIISAAAYPQGKAPIGCYTLPSGKIARVISGQVNVDSNQAANFQFYARESADTVAAPYSPMMLIGEFHGIADHSEIKSKAPGKLYTGPCDFITMAKAAAATSGIAVNLEFMVMDSSVLLQY